MGTLSPEDEKTLLWTCGTILVLLLLLVLAVGAFLYAVVQWVFS